MEWEGKLTYEATRWQSCEVHRLHKEREGVCRSDAALLPAYTTMCASTMAVFVGCVSGKSDRSPAKLERAQSYKYPAENISLK